MKKSKNFDIDKINMADTYDNSTSIVIDDSAGGSSVQSPISSPARSTTKLIKVRSRPQEYISDDDQAQDAEYEVETEEVKAVKKQQTKMYFSGLLKLQKIDEIDDERQKANNFLYKSSEYSSEDEKISKGSSEDNKNTSQYIEQSKEEDQEEKEQNSREKKYVASSFSDLVFSPMPKNCSLSCLITCKEEILSLTRSYDLYLIKEKKKIITALRSKIQMTSSFDIFDWKGKKKIGVIKGNFTGTQYIVSYGKEQREHCWIGYETNIFGLNHQREISVIRNSTKKLQKLPNFSQIKTYYDNGFSKKFQKYQNRRAEKKGENFQLDFKNKVDLPSIRNFIIEDKFAETSLLFGKKSQNMYYLEIGAPFSIIEAFGIAVSNLDRKILVR